MMNILYISNLASESWINNQHKLTGDNPGFAIQKFNRLIVKGLLENGANVLALSSPPNRVEQSLLVSSIEEHENGVHYKYIPYINRSILKSLCEFLYSFFYTLSWGTKTKNDKAIICDTLKISICMGALLASKINKVQNIGLVTDYFDLLVAFGKKTLKFRLASLFNNGYKNAFDKYILLTEQMNEVVNRKRHPYMILEALCDVSLSNNGTTNVLKAYPRTLIYAGEICERYGLKMLAEAFLKANVNDTKLIYFGSGSYVDKFKKLCAIHQNLEYHGVVPNEDVVAAEQKATILINPRFTTEAFTKYSFPSKNIEYMASGTPLLTTKLPGIPQAYNTYLFLFDEESIDAYAKTIRKVLSYSERELIDFGEKARQFVLKEKNNITQGLRIINFISNEE